MWKGVCKAKAGQVKNLSQALCIKPYGRRTDVVSQLAVTPEGLVQAYGLLPVMVSKILGSQPLVAASLTSPACSVLMTRLASWLERTVLSFLMSLGSQRPLTTIILDSLSDMMI